MSLSPCARTFAVWFTARLQVPEGTDNKPEQESDITSMESSARSTSPTRPNGSVANFESPVRHGNSIRTIAQSASRADVSRAAGPARSPAAPVRQKHKAEHVPNRSVLPAGVKALCFSSLLMAVTHICRSWSFTALHFCLCSAYRMYSSPSVPQRQVRRVEYIPIRFGIWSFQKHWILMQQCGFKSDI